MESMIRGKGNERKGEGFAASFLCGIALHIKGIL